MIGGELWEPDRRRYHERERTGSQGLTAPRRGHSVRSLRPEQFTATAIAADVRAGRRRAVDVVEESLERIARVNGSLNAFCEVRPAAARAAAASVDAVVAAGGDPGPLAGVPLAVKDVLWEEGIEATDGSRSLLGFVPPASAASVSRLVGAGAIVVGRTNQPEFCYRGISENELYGRTSNPWDVGRVPGGSSGGSGAAVAAGLVPLAIGTDGGGSIRIPASFCGVAGIKPTYGLVPREPQWAGWYSLTHVGPLAFTVEDTALMLSLMAGPDPLDPISLPPLGSDLAAAGRAGPDLRGLRIAYSEDLGYIRVDPGVRETFRRAIERFRALGAELEEAHPGLSSPLETWDLIACVDNLASEGHLLATGGVADDTRSLIEAGAAFSGVDYARARNAQAAYAASWGRFLGRYDLMLTPAMEVVAFVHGQTGPALVDGQPIGEFYDDWCHFSYPSNLSGQPAMSVPMGSAEEGLPIGLQIIGPRFGDGLVLRAAAAWERIAPWERPVLDDAPLVPDAPVRAGVRVVEGSARVVVRRAYSPRDRELVVETEPEPSV
jgi:Asp-tRNA(Asn)/Glu-tRNA(Gln) amidotransferase A subunit family amidase